MSKRYVLNPKTNRLVSADGCTGVKIINQLLTKKIQVKYQSTKKKQPVVKKKTPKQPVVKKKTPKKKQPVVKKETSKKKPTVVKQQNNQIGIFQKYDKIVEEIKSVYTALEKDVDYIYDLNGDDDPSDGFPDNFYIKFEKLKNKMPVFVKFSGFSNERIKQIIRTCRKNTFTWYDYVVNPLVYLEYVLNSILVGEPTSNLEPLLVLFGQYDPEDLYSSEPSLYMENIKPLTESRLSNYNTALTTTKSDKELGKQQYFKL